MPDVLLSITGLAVAAGGVRLMERLNLEVSAGEMVALTGPSGCGKTSLLRAVAQLDDPAAGEVRFRGRLPHELGWPQFRRHVVFVHQRPVMLDATAGENLRHPLRHRAVQIPFPADHAAVLLRQVGLATDLLGQPARTLSIGQQQRVSLIRALLVDPEVMLLDEPSSALDDDSRQSVETLLRERCTHAGKAAVVVTHDRAQARRLCDRHVDLKPHLTAAGGGPRDG